MKQLALVIDLNVCVGCHACVTSCKEWNNAGEAGPLADQNPYGKDPNGAFFNRVQTFEVGEFPNTETVHFPKSCLHCEDPPCVPVCPTGASYKRAEDGIVLVDYDKCIGCKYCAWACPYGAREMDPREKVMTKCTLCVDRIYDALLPPQVFRTNLELGLAPRQVVVCGLRAPLRHQGVAPRLADRGRDLRGRIVNVAEEPRAGRASEHACGLAVTLG